MEYTPEFLLSLLDGAEIPKESEEWCDVTIPIRDGWKVIIFYDCGELDYIEGFVDPSGMVVNFWDWPETDAVNRLINWRG